MYVGGLRGFHSTGIAAIDRDFKIEVYKDALTPLSFFGANKGHFNSLMTTTHRAYIGHNRFATVGAVDADNAHPYDYEGSLVGAHNGTLRGRSDANLNQRKEFGTDSAALFGNIATRGVEEVIPEMEGAWALVWFDKRNNTLNFLRNKERPLHYAFNETGKMLYWASEAGMLRWILERNGVKLHSTGIMSLKEDTHVSWVLPKIAFNGFPEPVVKELKGWRAPPFQRATGDIEEWEEHWTAPWGRWTGQKDTSARHIDVTKRTPTLDVERLPSLPAPKGPASELKSLPVKQLNANDETNVSKTAKKFGPPYINGPLKVAYEQGKRAGASGKPATICPFAVGTQHRSAWLDGHFDSVPEHAAEGFNGVSHPNVRTFSIKGYNNEYLTEYEWKKRTKSCCSWCDQVQQFSEMPEAHWISRDTFFCDECVTQDKMAQEVLKDYA